MKLCLFQEISVNHTCYFLSSVSKKRGLVTSETTHLSTRRGRVSNLEHSRQAHASCLLLHPQVGCLSPFLQRGKLRLKEGTQEVHSLGQLLQKRGHTPAPHRPSDPHWRRFEGRAEDTGMEEVCCPIPCPISSSR